MDALKDLKEVQETLTQDNADEQIIRELAAGEKIFVYTKDVHGFEAEIKIKSPSLSQKNKSDTLYSKKFNALLKDEDHLTNTQIIELAEKRGILTKQDQEELVTIDRKIRDVKNKIKEEKSEKKTEKLKEELGILRDKKFRLALKVSSLTSTSIENLSETEKVEYLIINCIFDASGEKDVPLYKSKEELEQETDLDKLQRIVFDARSVWFGEGLADFLHLDD
jgi:hypothetical protein